MKDLEEQQKETHEKLTSLDGLKRDVEGVLQLRATKEAIADLEGKIRQLKAATVAVRAGGLGGGRSRSTLTSPLSFFRFFVFWVFCFPFCFPFCFWWSLFVAVLQGHAKAKDGTLEGSHA